MGNREKRLVAGFRPSPNAIASAEQDEAAGGVGRRMMRATSGAVVMVSLSATPSGEGFSVVMRFKRSGCTSQKRVGFVTASSRKEALCIGWRMIREEKIVEKEGWAWVESSTAD